jgi:hypothetical protein
VVEAVVLRVRVQCMAVAVGVVLEDIENLLLKLYPAM